MDKLKFNQTGGHKLTTDDFAFMQGAYSIFNALAGLAGHLTIVQGCTVSGNVVSNGVVAIDGELYPFVGGPIGDKVIITTDIVKRQFENGQLKTVYEIKKARFGNGTNTYNWADFTRIGTLKELLGKFVEATVEDLGFVRYATTEEIEAGETKGVITAESLPRRTATETRVGLVQKATAVEAAAGQNDEHFVTAKQLKDNTVKVLASGTKSIPANVGIDNIDFVFNDPIGTTNYMVMGELYNVQQASNDIYGWHITGKTSTGFKLHIDEQENAGATGQWKFNYKIIAL